MSWVHVGDQIPGPHHIRRDSRLFSTGQRYSQIFWTSMYAATRWAGGPWPHGTKNSSTFPRRPAGPPRPQLARRRATTPRAFPANLTPAHVRLRTPSSANQRGVHGPGAICSRPRRNGRWMRRWSTGPAWGETPTAIKASGRAPSAHPVGRSPSLPIVCFLRPKSSPAPPLVPSLWSGKRPESHTPSSFPRRISVWRARSCLGVRVSRAGLWSLLVLVDLWILVRWNHQTHQYMCGS